MNIRHLIIPATFLFAAIGAAAPLPDPGPGSGLVVVVGQDDLEQTGKLAAGGRYLVHQLVPAAQVAALRAAALERGLHGSVVIDALPAAGPLPHPSRFADLVMADLAVPGCPAQAELERIANVGATLHLRVAGTWRAQPRAPEAGIADWTAKSYDASGNNVSADRKAGPPQLIQWQAGPAFADGSGNGQYPVIGKGAFACVSAVDGSLVVRSAGNGLGRWRSQPTLAYLTELLIAGDRLLTRADPTVISSRVLGKFESGSLISFDLANGATSVLTDAPVMPLDPKFNAPMGGVGFPSAIAAGSTLVVVAAGDLAVMDAASGKRRWAVSKPDSLWFSPRILDDQVIVAECPKGDKSMGRGRVDSAYAVRAICAFALADGTPRWRSEVTIPTPQPDPLPIGKDGKPVASVPKASLKPMTCAAGKVFLHTCSYQAAAADSAIMALDAKTGKQLWRFALSGRGWTNTDSASCILYRDGELIYIGGHSAGGIARFDPETGAQKGEFKIGLRHFVFAGECSMSRGTTDWLIKAAVTWYDKDLNAISRPANRGTCGAGVFPAQGMVFTTPIGCDCTDYARGYQGLSCEPVLPVADEQRLTNGPGKPGKSLPVAGDWPMFMADARRSLRSTVALPAELAVRWTVAGAPRPMAGVLLDDRRRDEYWIGALTAPVIAGGTVYAGLPEAHAVIAHDAATGKLLWRTPVGGPVDTPPTIAGGLCVFGCQDGAIYALSTADGALVWRFDGAPGRRLAMLNGRLASAFPAPGSVVVVGDKVHATVGYHVYLGGLTTWMLDLASGKPLATNRVGDPTVSVPNKETVPNLLNDILVAADDGGLWIGKHLRIRPDGTMNAKDKYSLPPIAMSRRVSVVGFTQGKRGGSTHSWGSPTWQPGRGMVRAWTMVQEGDRIYGLQDASLDAGTLGEDLRARATPLWSLTNAKDFKDLEVKTALIKAGDRLFMGGGSYDGAKGSLYVISLDGKILQRFDLPSRLVPNGLAAAGGQIVATCVDGSLVAIAGK